MSDELDTSAAVANYLQSRKPEEAVRTSMTLAAGSNPDAEAEYLRLAREAGIPVDSVRDNKDAVKQRVSAPNYGELATKFPSTTAYLSTLENARIAHDDVGNLTGIEQAIRGFMDPQRQRAARPVPQVMRGQEFSQEVRRLVESNPSMDFDTARRLLADGAVIDNQSQFMGEARGPAPTLSNIVQGLFSPARFRSMSQGASVMAADVLGFDPAPAIRRYEVARSRAEALDPEFETATARGLYSGGVSFVQNAPGIAASIMAGNPLPGLLMAGGGVSAEAYGKYRARGATAGEATVGALGEGAVEIATEALPMGFLVEKLGKAGAGTFLKGLLARELPSEQVATLAQDAIDTAIANPDKTWAQYVAERPGAAYQTLLATLVQSGTMGAVNVVANRVTGFDAKAQRAEVSATRAQEFAGLIEQSKLRERDPEAFKQFIAEVAESGETPTEFYIDAQQLVNSLNQSAVTIEQLRAFAPAVADQLEASSHVPGADIRVPVAEFAAAPSNITTGLIDHLRENPQAMSRAEAQAFLKEAGPNIEREVASALTTETLKAETTQAIDKLRNEFQSQLDAVGKFRPEVNRAYATLLGNFYGAQAERAGMSAEEFSQRYGLRVAGKEAKGRQRLEQGLSPADATRAAEVFRGAGLNLSVVDTIEGLPGSGRRKIQSEGAQGVRGLYDAATDSTFLVSSNIASLDEAFFVGLHEAFHRGLRKSFGPEVAPILTLIHDGNERVQREAAAFMQKHGVDLHEAVDEVLADMAGQGEAGNLKGFDQLLALLREAVAKLAKALGVKVEITDQMLTDLVAGVRRAGMQDKVNILNQGPRGALSFGDDITASPSVIALLEGADLSTFIHESGHFFLEVQADLASRIQRSAFMMDEMSEGERQIVADMEKILNWFGVKGDGDRSALDVWSMMTLEQKEAHHEAWARGFERYVMEGKAPSQELQSLFSKFRAWLLSVYKTLTHPDLDVKLTADVRQVMDRMLASDQAIAEAKSISEMGPLFKTAEEAEKYGVQIKEYSDLHALGERATAAADAELDARLMKDMKWLSRARDKAIKAAQAEADALRKEVEREVRAQVMAQPIYQAWQFLTGKSLRVEPGIQAAETIDVDRQSGKLRTSYLKESHPDLWKTLSERHMTSDTNGMDPDIVADIIPGFSSGDELVKALAAAPAPQNVIEELTDQQMLQRFGDITSQEALNRAADEAVHNQLRARVIATELKALAKANAVKETGDSLLTRQTVDVMATAAEDYAARVIARQRIKDLRPKQYTAAEARSAKLAEQALGKSTDEAAMHKRNQLINNFAAKAAYEAQKEIQDAMAFFRKVISGAQDKVSKSRDFDVVQAARAILADYGIGNRGEKAQKYLEAVERNDPAMYKVLRDKVDNLTMNAKPVNELTVEQFRGLEEEIRGLWHLAKRSRQMEIDGKLIDIESAKIPLVERIEALGIPERVPGEGMAVTDAERRLSRLQSARAALRRVESWVHAKDGSQAIGPFRRFIWQPVKEAADAYRADKARYLKRYRDLLAGLDVGRSRIDAPELGYTFGHSRGGSGKAEILHAVLHTGNASNKRKLLVGRGWGQVTEDGGLDSGKWDRFVNRMTREGVLTRADFDFAQGVWDLLEDMKPLAQKTHRDVFGRYFDEVTADPFTVQFPDGQASYRGGYVPAIMDAEVVKDAKTRALAEDEQQTLAYAFPSTNRGFTKARVEINRPLLLDLRLLSNHIDKVLLFSHLEQPIRDVRKVLTSSEVSEPLHRIDPSAYDGLLTPWMNRAARQTVETKIPGDNNLMRFFSKARSRAGMAAMFANVTNAAQQITGLSIAAVKVKPKHLVTAMAEWVIAPRQTNRAVAEASPYMASRMDNEIAQMNDAIDDILLNPNVYERAQAWTAKHAYFLQAALDNVIGPVVWTGAYNQALEAGRPELDARRLADAAVRETQGSTLPEDVSRIETGNAFVRMFTQFAGYFNMQANTLGSEFVVIMHEQGLRKGMGRGLYVFTLGFLVPAMVSELIVQAFRGGPDDEDKDGSTIDDWLMAVLVMGNVRAALGMVPLVGQTANAAINMGNKKPYDDRISTAPAISMIESAVRAPYSVYNAIADDGNRRKAVRDLATFISMTTGLPANAIARPLGYGLDVGQGNTAPTSEADAVRGYVTGVSSPGSKN